MSKRTPPSGHARPHQHRPSNKKLTRMYASGEKSNSEADNSIAAVRNISDLAKNEQAKLGEMHQSFPAELQKAVLDFAKTGFVVAAASAYGVPPMYVAMASIVYGITAAAAAPVSDPNALVWKNKFDESNLKGICTAKNYGDICGRSHLNFANGTNILPAVTREINAHTTGNGFTWGGWFTMRDCFTKQKVQNAIVGILEMFGMDKSLNAGQLCSFSSDKFQGNIGHLICCRTVF